MVVVVMVVVVLVRVCSIATTRRRIDAVYTRRFLNVVVPDGSTSRRIHYGLTIGETENIAGAVKTLRKSHTFDGCDPK